MTTRTGPLPIFWPMARPEASTLENCLSLKLLDLAGARLRLHGFRAGLQDVELAVDAVPAPLDVHRAAVVLLDDQRVAGQFQDFVVVEREPVAQAPSTSSVITDLPATFSAEKVILITLEPMLRRTTAVLPAASIGLCT